ncbi:hypothetical protein BGZ81_005107 [Podila clonocystis]|nr:hypothetical protein BGZ81_005107 [Podila clonocystis]
MRTLIVVSALFTLASIVQANRPLSLAQSTPVDVTLFVMSRCPDAMKCEATFAKVFAAPSLVPVNPTLSFIGSIERTVNTSTTSVTTTVTCKHGPEECAGNIQQLCFQKQHPDHRVWVPFVVGMNSWRPRRIGELQYVRDVANRIGGVASDEYKLTLVEQCAQGPEGHELLVQSVQNTLDHQVGTSCTVFIDNKKRCVVDGGVWRECPGGFQVADFVQTINEAAARVSVFIRTKLYRVTSW